MVVFIQVFKKKGIVKYCLAYVSNKKHILTANLKVLWMGGGLFDVVIACKSVQRIVIEGVEHLFAGKMIEWSCL